jgi:glucosyl-dolichyl phosphate glucuronosyltransferase
MTPTVTVVVCTWNRAAMLASALEALTAQQHAPPHEILVVDNGSSDGTADVIRCAAAVCPQVTRVFEPRPGLAYARNAALARARASIVAFVDDDVRVGPDWMARIVAAFERWPAASCVGGPVVPEWPAAVPAWLTPRHWAPLGVQDYGTEPVRADSWNPICLIGANVAFRRSALEAIGEFNTGVQRVGAGAGSTEDHELHLRFWGAGHHGMYEPALRVRAIVLPERLRKTHHRVWHFGHGRHVARMCVPEMEATRVGRVFGIPAHLLRQAIVDGWGCVRSLVTGDEVQAFEREAHLWFIAGFIRERTWARNRVPHSNADFGTTDSNPDSNAEFRAGIPNPNRS